MKLKAIEDPDYTKKIFNNSIKQNYNHNNNNGDNNGSSGSGKKSKWDAAMDRVDADSLDKAWDAILKSIQNMVIKTTDNNKRNNNNGNNNKEMNDSIIENKIIRLFNEIDSDGSGELECSELGGGLKACGIRLTDRQLLSLTHVIGGYISRIEFIQHTLKIIKRRQEKHQNENQQSSSSSSSSSMSLNALTTNQMLVYKEDRSSGGGDGSTTSNEKSDVELASLPSMNLANPTRSSPLPMKPPMKSASTKGVSYDFSMSDSISSPKSQQTTTTMMMNTNNKDSIHHQQDQSDGYTVRSTPSLSSTLATESVSPSINQSSFLEPLALLSEGDDDEKDDDEQIISDNIIDKKKEKKKDKEIETLEEALLMIENLKKENDSLKIQLENNKNKNEIPPSSSSSSSTTQKSPPNKKKQSSHQFVSSRSSNTSTLTTNSTIKTNSITSSSSSTKKGGVGVQRGGRDKKTVVNKPKINIEKFIKPKATTPPKEPFKSKSQNENKNERSRAMSLDDASTIGLKK
eukprot:CAMPEP_0114334316 /NCGR_PEP_ID=MMETSP0101-20121206/4296_1 /TAXON_ID=38822 ORGANISM="Pteridomonas danica, Strain PT" /NCGR_SAMPLE_ID=MMETSP0101 /ASSEMBLY_ACC=CAM_ASM_000211 /LENGTH=515 /DNA_ID=CAMNT_0001465539 /DNA_START=2407 /DNA_END=3954 /DNA_ORIENTATION=+